MKIRLISIVVALFLMLVATASMTNNSVNSINVYKIDNGTEGWKIKSETLVTYTYKKEVKQFVKAFGYADKEVNWADMKNPDYKVEFGDESYFLWLNEMHGMYEKENDPNMLYIISEEAAININQILKDGDQ